MKISIKGVLIGGIVDIVATNLLAIPIAAYAMVSLHRNDVSQAAILHAIHSSPVLLSLQMVVGVLCSLLGGYLAARIARREAILNGAASSWLCLCFGIYSLFIAHTTALSALHIGGLVVSPVVGALGGYLRSKQRAFAAASG